MDIDDIDDTDENDVCCEFKCMNLYGTYNILNLMLNYKLQLDDFYLPIKVMDTNSSTDHYCCDSCCDIHNYHCRYH